MNQKKFIITVFAVCAIIVIGAVGYVVVNTRVAAPTSNTVFTPTPVSTPTPTTGESSNLLTAPLAGGEVNTSGYRYEFAHKQDPPGNTLNDHLVFVSPSGEKTVVPDSIWFQIYAATAFDKTEKQGGQNLTSFYMPVHPTNKDIIFLSTEEPLVETFSRITNRIYSYNLKTSELKEVYSETVENNSPMNPHSARILRTVGTDGSKVLVLYDDYENSPGPCTKIWYHYKDRVAYLELADVQGGLKSYTVPSYKVEEGRVDSDKCLQELQ
ncbi:MAG: hypothetical protein WC817_02895 [Patescibacteria group bacterium]|jgi:hypothetical protein